MAHEPIRSIIHKKVGGGPLHAHIILIYTHMALQKGYRVEDDTKVMPQLGMELPDVVITKTEKVHDGARIVRKTWRYRVEVIDTHDPVPDGSLRGGYDGLFKLFVSEAAKWCAAGHGDKYDCPTPPNHPLCYDSIIRLCERNLP